ncbi:hypothetical protein IDH44_11675 [Paenibacillus sp. IB182496]|uniref:Uncharacterized protein n=1 Tax=Paenibacillus sabuli TaxID=2772509 RepID=A0A927GSM6_9BACL|nr:DUF4352 domain-containing protein [Paenibacillus sabuli]MBD2845852.1 hypothetical protein [Paenibacillus sabuli]
MNAKLFKHGIATAAACALLLQPVLPVAHSLLPQSTVAAAAANPLSSKIVRLTSNASLYVRDAQLLMQDQKLMLAFTVTITNKSTKELDLLDYWVRVKSKSGKVFTAALTETDKTKKKVAPSSSLNLTYYATVDRQTKLTDLVFSIVKFDLNVAGYERNLGTITYPSNATGATPVFQPSIMLLNGSKVKGAVKQYFVTQDQDGIYLTISYLVENVGFSSVNLSNVGFALQTESYSVYDVNAAALAQLTIQPKERKIVTVQAKLPNVIAGKPVKLIPYTKDETTNIQLPAGQFAIPILQPAPAVAAGATRNVYMNGEMVATKAAQVMMNDANGETELTVDFKIENIGQAAIALPALSFALKTSDNVTYPLTYTQDDKNNLLPRIARTLSLSGAVPENKIKGAQLIVRTSAAAGEEGGIPASGYLIGSYKLQGPSSQEGGVGSAYTYNNDYSVELAAIQRAPMTNNDVLTAELRITNRSKSAKSTPNLSGYFLINGVRVSGESHTVSLDKQINIAAGDSYDTLVYVNIPYTTSIDTVSFVLTEPAAEGEARKLFQFTDQPLSEFDDYAPASGYVIDQTGSRSQVDVRTTRLFKGSNGGNYFYTEFELTNQEPRAAQPARIGGYLEDANGQLAPIELTQVVEKVMPNGKILLSGWSSLSKTFDIQNYKLVFGQALSEQGGGEEEPTQSVIVKPAVYDVVDAAPTLDTDLEDISFSAYSLSLRDIVANLHVTGAFSVEGIRLELDYDLAVDNAYDFVSDGHKLLLEFVNQDQIGTTYSHEVELFEAAEGSGAPVMIEGTNKPLELIFNDPVVQGKIAEYDTFTLNVYDVFGNAKLLIGSKEINWFGR